MRKLSTVINQRKTNKISPKLPQINIKPRTLHILCRLANNVITQPPHSTIKVIYIDIKAIENSRKRPIKMFYITLIDILVYLYFNLALHAQLYVDDKPVFHADETEDGCNV